VIQEYNNPEHAFTRFLGGEFEDTISDLAVDSNNNIIVTGYTTSPDFPTLSGYDSTYNGKEAGEYGGDVFITSLFPNGSLRWSTFFGGSRGDAGQAICVDSADNVVIVGSTFSTDFPVINGHDTSQNGNLDIFVTKFQSNGSLIWSTFLGSFGTDDAWGVTIDEDDSVFVIGRESDSPNSRDALIAKFNANGSLEWSETIGGSGNEGGADISIDSQGHLVIVGYTSSSDFPSNYTYSSGYQDIFVVKLTNSGSFVWGRVFAGSEIEHIESVTIDPYDNIILSGLTWSNDFPLENATTAQMQGAGDIYVVKLSPDGQMLWGSLFGGGYDDESRGIFSDNRGNIFITGYTTSPDYPITTGYTQTKVWTKTFLTIVTKDGVIAWSETFGRDTGFNVTNPENMGFGIVLDNSDNILIGGFAESDAFPATIGDPHAGRTDGFIIYRISPFNQFSTSITSTIPPLTTRSCTIPTSITENCTYPTSKAESFTETSSIYTSLFISIGFSSFPLLVGLICISVFQIRKQRRRA
ncbi:MAG: SBBP repeat-containing protein, partial [Candidatus Thorarchaeota archaeon]